MVARRGIPKVPKGGEQGGQHHYSPEDEHVCPARITAVLAFTYPDARMGNEALQTACMYEAAPLYMLTGLNN